MKYTYLLLSVFLFASCASKKKIEEAQLIHSQEMAVANQQLGECGEKLNELMSQNEQLKSQLNTAKTSLELRQEQMADLRSQLDDVKTQRDRQVDQVGELTVLSQSANDNIKETLDQLEDRDKYIKFLQAAKTKADSINLALAINLKGALSSGIEDEDVEIKVDKTVVFINLSDKMLYYSGSSNLTTKANEVLGKIAKIVESRPNFEVMVEGYTDNVPIKNSCLEDNWDLSVKRATSVVRLLQDKFNIDPNRLIAAGRGQYNALASNDTAEGRATNRRTRIIILPKINEFYDLLNPDMAPK
ncbi:MAG: OmpA family protein [Saprospiraceae bacterium]|nr:OmpA family protein [Bacteroidia bacterium]NNE16443.1 OmpA family protein [Saprospiraceae bacterium]NNL92458.1 OmpA family protein [Saprospiraceae bacterium]